MAEKLDKHVLKNGMVLLGEPMEGVESAAFGFMLPGGASRLPEGCSGAANVVLDWIFRGAGDKNSRQLSDALDGIGLHRGSSVNSAHVTVGGVLEAGNLGEALDLHGDIIRQPRLEQEQFEPARQLAIDGVLALEDDPRQKVTLILREQFYPTPLGRSAVGNVEDLKALTPETTRRIIQDGFNLSDTIFAVAGKYEFDSIVRQFEDSFETEPQETLGAIKFGLRDDRYTHISNEGAQVHIGIMTGTVTVGDDDYYNARVAISVLSGGMSARLFTEVREKRGLCYAIGARYHTLKEAAGIMCYAGTTPEKAQETLDVITAEFNRLSEGISEDEIERAKVGLKSALILQSESSSSRAGGIASDYHLLGRVRSLDEIKTRIEETTVDSVLVFLRDNRFEDFTVVTIGPKEVKVK
ncbi:MAG TPA: pitrilysin family protein [Sedimentisphaerales bacterium]|nr:pitrilysin family protein [Sedimentisphaerales bacterium]